MTLVDFLRKSDFNKGVELSTTEYDTEALVLFDLAIARHPGHVDTRNNHGEALSNPGRQERRSMLMRRPCLYKNLQSLSLS